MKKIAYAAFTSAAALALAACGDAEEATEAPMAEDVETMAEEPIADETMTEEGMAEETDPAAAAEEATEEAETATDPAM